MGGRQKDSPIIINFLSTFSEPGIVLSALHTLCYLILLQLSFSHVTDEEIDA